MGLLTLIDIYQRYTENKNKNKEGFSNGGSVASFITSLIKGIIMLVVAVKLARCHNKGDTIHLLGAIFFPSFYVLLMLFKGNICKTKETTEVAKEAMKYLHY